MFWREALGRLLFDAWTQARSDAAFAARATSTLQPHGLAGLLQQPPDGFATPSGTLRRAA